MDRLERKFEAMYGPERYLCSVAAAVIGSAVVGAAVSSSASSKASKAQSQSANAATQAQLESSRDANALQERIYNQNRTDALPWMNAGQGALNQLAWKMGVVPVGGNNQPAGTPYQGAQADFGSLSRNFTSADLAADPVYQSGLQFGLDQGTRGIERQAAASGSQLSGATLKALARYGNDYGTTKAQGAYERFGTNQATQFNRLSGISGTGQQQVNQIGAAGQNYANSVGSNTMATGNNVANNLLSAGQARASNYANQGNAWNNALGGIANTFQQNQMMNRFFPSSAGSSNTSPYYDGSGVSI